MAADHEELVRPEDLVGTWRLLSYTAQAADAGAPHHPLGHDAAGFLIYTSDGYMSVQMMRRDRLDYDLPDISGGTAEQNACAAAGYLAYGGPYDIDENTGEVRHFVEVSLLPNWLGGMQLRRPTLLPDQLTMRARYAVGATTVDSVLTWRRAADPSRYSATLGG